MSSKVLLDMCKYQLSADGGGNDASVQVGDTQLLADAEQEPLRVQPA